MRIAPVLVWRFLGEVSFLRMMLCDRGQFPSLSSEDAIMGMCEDDTNRLAICLLAVDIARVIANLDKFRLRSEHAQSTVC